MSILVTLHLLAALIWVGGMFFAYNVLRPTAAQRLQPPLRLDLWVGVFQRFFPWVWLCLLTLLTTGYWMVFGFFGGLAHAPLHIHLMQAGAIIMVLIFLHVFFAPFKRLQQAVIIEDYPQAAQHLNRIRVLIGVNTLLGLGIVVVASAGRYL